MMVIAVESGAAALDAECGSRLGGTRAGLHAQASVVAHSMCRCGGVLISTDICPAENVRTILFFSVKSVSWRDSSMIL